MTIRRFRMSLQATGARGLAALLSLLLLAPPDAVVYAQDAAPAAPEAEQEAPPLPNDQLESLVAPIALYPDPLLAQVLVASTYPLDIVEAQQWLGKNSALKGDELTAAAEKQHWDPSVQAMVVFPDVVKRMSENVKWTTDLGNAFLAQEQGVMDAVQRLRAKAKDAGKLDSTDQQKVETKVVESKTIVEIQPTSTEVVYVPTYSPTAVWGAPMYPYPPMYYPPYYPGAALVSFGVGMAVGAAISGGWGWGCGWGGGNNTININNNNNFVNNSNRQNNVNRSGNSNWQHNAQQRGGVPYKDKATANKYGGGARGDSMSTRQSQARSREGGAGSASNRGGGSAASNRAGSGGASNRGGGGASNFSSGSSNRVGGRDVSPSSRSGSSNAFGGSQSGNRARASSSRGSSSMSSSRGGGASRGGGGRRR